MKAQVTRGMASFTDTDEVGIYTVVTARGETRVAVNLMSAEESNLTPRPVPAAVDQGRWPGQVRPFTKNRRHVLYQRILP